MVASWLTWSEPGKRGLRPSSSAKMQPTDHMSTAFVYVSLESTISGARYQRVTTYSVRKSRQSEGLTPRDSPKSVIFRSQFSLTSRLDGLRSRCSTLHEWRYLRPRSSWYRKYCTCWLESGCGERMTLCRSVSISD